MRTMSRLYDDYRDAVAIVEELERVDRDPETKISLLANENAHGRDKIEDHPETESHAGAGAGIGATVGGVVGILTGLGLMAIPGVGPLVAAGWLATTLAGAGAGAVAGGLVGALTHTGVSHEEAEVYDEGLRRGGTLVSVQAADRDVSTVERILDSRESRPWQARREDYIASGWKPAPARS